MRAALELLAGRAIVTDLGRNAESQGLSRHGALDQGSAMLANALVGNPLDVPLLEITLAETIIRTTGHSVLAVTGATTEVNVNGRVLPTAQPLQLAPGQTLRIPSPTSGLRTYVAVHGSLEGESFLGSVAPDPFIGFGRVLTEGDSVPTCLNTPALDHPCFRLPLMRPWVVNGVREEPLATGASTAASSPREVHVEVTVGPDASMFGSTLQRLYDEAFEVTPRSDAMGIRMQGPAPERESSAEILSTGVPPGAVEVPGSGEIIVLHRARGITAGYAIPAVVTTLGLDVLSQVRPGTRIRFRPATTDQAISQFRAQRSALNAVRQRTATILSAHGLDAS